MTASAMFVLQGRLWSLLVSLRQCSSYLSGLPIVSFEPGVLDTLVDLLLPLARMEGMHMALDSIIGVNTV